MASGEENQVVEVYGSPFSQPSRAVLWLCKLLDIPHEFKPVNLKDGEQHTPQYKAVCYFEKVPAIRHGTFCLTESGAILNFLSRKYGKGTSWWPEDDEIAARVVEYGMWHGGTNGLQRAGVSWVFPAVFSPTRDEARIAEGKATFLKALSVLEEFFLSRGTLFIAASHPTVADLLAACDLAQICMIEDSGFSIESFPKLKAWFNTMRSQPHYEALHEAVMSRKKIEFWH